MMNDQQSETQPTQITAPVSAPAPRRGGRGKTIGLVVLGLIFVVVLGVLLGYRNGIQRRKALETSQIITKAAEQFELGLVDMQQGRYEIARQRFEYVISIDPAYPGVTDKLAEVLLVLNATATPTAAPQVTPTAAPATADAPVVDAAAIDALFTQAEDYLAAKEWTQAIETLEQIRKQDATYRAVEIDGMIYLALRQRGVQKITRGELEGGIYDLTLAEKFGVLDTEADSWRTWARLYITGASYWDVDWPRAIEAFRQVAQMTPNLSDSSGWTAAKRYVDAIVGYGDYLVANGRACDADEVYNEAYQYTGNEIYYEMILNAQELCK